MPVLYTIPKLNEKKPKDSKLTAIGYGKQPRSDGGNLRTMICCLCECGIYVMVQRGALISGSSKSCGCNSYKGQKGIGRKNKIVHPTLYYLHNSMINRCYNKNNKSYARYGGKGVKVCEEWLISFDSFANWCLTNGWNTGLQLDKDILGNGKLYSPDTCKFVTALENSNNRSSCIKYDYKGEMLTLTEICRKLKLNYKRVAYRMREWKDLDKAISVPKKGKRYSYKGQMLTLSEICLLEKVPIKFIRQRLNERKMSLEDAISEPKKINQFL